MVFPGVQGAKKGIKIIILQITERYYIITALHMSMSSNPV